ncbi:SMP-30/gluconolactonase/LRE family protein [Arsenicitalea aurantiaca]|uniref:SMP-30/gluconolactonase/LRE family protein n=1 Tax=Arsenicitalea aurantiaca TaxID=1783274 RepID=A0A433XFF4_9HYPH|nr:SMP-30/gluconolactonase/LRE family protein [Arsenicitalea aurantiaca]RUT32786.1 SMP-30/gluconolactonase/LRE family protein [Arsenicitalea aurantiaca]
MPVAIETITDTRTVLGESPVWSGQENALYWIDIPGKALFRLDMSEAAPRRWDLPTEPGSIGLFANGDILIALRTGIVRFVQATGAMTPLAAPDYDQARLRFNDGRPDRRGRFWVSTIDESRQHADARLYRYADGALDTLHEGGITVGNGLAFSPDDKWLYFCDTPSRRIWRFAFDIETGTIRDQTVFADIEEGLGRPDGAAIDAEGCYWSALIDGIGRFTPEGRLDRHIEIPAGRITMCAFGGTGLDTLFLTTASPGAVQLPREPGPLAGRLLAIRPGVSGLPEPRVAG